MLLYERLRRYGLPDDNHRPVLELLEEATVILVDNVARFYYVDNEQEEWDITKDFPNVAPPWPVAFYEYAHPRFSNSMGSLIAQDQGGSRWGTLVVAEDIQSIRSQKRDVESDAKQMAWMVLSSREEIQQEIWRFAQERILTPDILWNALSEEIRQGYRDAASSEKREAFIEQNDVRWACNAFSFWLPPRSDHVFPMMHYSYPLTGHGQLITDLDGNVIGPFGPMSSSSNPDAVRQLSYMPLHVPFLAMSFAHCKNVTVTSIDPPEKLSRKQEKRYGIPKVRYHVLQIDPMREVLRREGEMSSHSSAPKALHICRGHFKDYRERGLFGKYHGLFWWDAHARGSLNSGAVVKDYSIKGGRS